MCYVSSDIQHPKSNFSLFCFIQLLGNTALESETDPEELQLQATVLKARIEAQNEKIWDLESEIRLHTKALERNEHLLQSVSVCTR